MLSCVSVSLKLRDETDWTIIGNFSEINRKLTEMANELRRRHYGNQSKLEQIIRAKVLIKMLEENGKFRRPSFSKLPIDSIIKQFEEKKGRKLPIYFKKTLVEEIKKRDW